MKPEPPANSVKSSSAIARRRRAAQENGSSEYKARKQRILEAAAARFNADGFDQADLADIAAQAGIERANIYYYTEGKEDLYLQVLLAVKADVVRVAERVAKSPAPTPERLRTLMVDLLSELGRHYPYLYLRYSQVTESFAARHPDNQQVKAVLRMTERHFQAFRSVIRDGMRDGTFVTELSAGIMAEAAIGMVLHTQKWFDPSRSPYSAGHLGSALADTFLDGLRARSHGSRTS